MDNAAAGSGWRALGVSRPARDRQRRFRSALGPSFHTRLPPPPRRPGPGPAGRPGSARPLVGPADPAPPPLARNLTDCRTNRGTCRCARRQLLAASVPGTCRPATRGRGVVCCSGTRGPLGPGPCSSESRDSRQQQTAASGAQVVLRPSLTQASHRQTVWRHAPGDRVARLPAQVAVTVHFAQPHRRSSSSCCGAQPRQQNACSWTRRSLHRSPAAVRAMCASSATVQWRRNIRAHCACGAICAAVRGPAAAEVHSRRQIWTRHRQWHGLLGPRNGVLSAAAVILFEQ